MQINKIFVFSINLVLWTNCCCLNVVSNVDLQQWIGELAEMDSVGVNDTEFKLNYGNPANGNPSLNQNLIQGIDRNFLAKPSVTAFFALIKSTIEFTAPKDENRLPQKRQTGFSEDKTKDFQNLVGRFFDLLLETAIMNRTRLFLQAAGFVEAKSPKLFNEWMRDLWLTPIANANLKTSGSGFQHVFLGELASNKEIKGLHSWLRFALLERNNEIKYGGFYGKPNNAAAFVKFNWRQYSKPKGSFLLFSSPEFDLAVFTICFVTRSVENKCSFCYRGCNVDLVTHRMLKDKWHITTAFPMRTVCGLGVCSA